MRLPSAPSAAAIATLALVALVAAALLATATAWPPSWGSPTSEGPQHTSSLADTADQMGYDVRASLLGADATPTTEPDRMLYVVPATATSDGGPAADRLLGLAEDGARVLLLDEGTGASALADRGWTLQTTPVYGADLDGETAGSVALRWPIDGTRHAVEGRTPLPLVPADPDTTPAGVPISTSNRTFADLDGDGTLTDDDVRGPFTVGVDLTLEDGGRFVYATTPQPVTNAAGDRAGADAFREALLVTMLPEGGTVVLDTSHADRPTGVDATHQIARAGAWTATCTPCNAAAVALVAGVGLIAARAHGSDLDGWAHHEPTLDEPLYPDPEIRVDPTEEVDA